MMLSFIILLVAGAAYNFTNARGQGGFLKWDIIPWWAFHSISAIVILSILCNMVCLASINYFTTKQRVYV